MSEIKKPKVIAIDINEAVKAEWNYKTDGSQEDIDKLKLSIEADSSAGVLAVREIEVEGELKYEVMDGNHRLEALRQLGWKKIAVENFGPITIGKAVTIARRRNHNWFEDNLFKLGELYREHVIPEFGVDEISKILPDSMEDIENMVNLGNFEWDPPQMKEKGSENEKDESSDEGESDESSEDIKVDSDVQVIFSLNKDDHKKVAKLAKEDGHKSVSEYALEVMKGLASGKYEIVENVK